MTYQLGYQFIRALVKQRTLKLNNHYMKVMVKTQINFFMDYI